MTKDCGKGKVKLSAYLDNELTSQEQEKIKQHLSICSHCQQEVKLLARTWEALETWETTKTSDNFEMKVWQRVKEKGQRRSPIWHFFKALLNVPVLVPATLVLVLGLVFGNYLGTIRYPEPSYYSNKNALYLDIFDVLPDESFKDIYITLFCHEENNN